MGLKRKAQPKPKSRPKPKRRRRKPAPAPPTTPALSPIVAPVDDAEGALAKAWEQFNAATADIAANGFVHVTEKGYRYSNPAVNQRKEALAQIAALTKQLAAVEAQAAKPAGVMTRKR